MRNWKKVLTTVVLTLAMMVLGIGAASTSASASTWHKGLPSIVKKHKLWVNTKKVKFGSSNQFYYRSYFATTGKKTKMDLYNHTVPYMKSDGKYYAFELFFNYGNVDGISRTAYHKVAKNTYNVKSSLKRRSGWPDNRFKIKKSGSKLTIYQRQYWNHIDPNLANNRTWKKWKKLGKYEYVKKATMKKADKRDPLFKK